MTPDALRSHVLVALAEVAPEADDAAIDPRLSFHDQFGIDSVDFMNLMLALERHLELRIPEADYPRLSTLDGCITYLSARFALPEQAGSD